MKCSLSFNQALIERDNEDDFRTEFAMDLLMKSTEQKNEESSYKTSALQTRLP